MSRRIIICGECNQERDYFAHGLCRLCYFKDYYNKHRDKQNAQASRRYYENLEEAKAYRRQYYKEHREQTIARSCQWQAENREAKRFYDHNRYLQNREAIKHRTREWRKTNPDKASIYNRRRKAHERAAHATLTNAQIEQLLAIGRATYPGKALHLDHIVPISRGGNTTLANVQAIPASLNMFKRDKLPQEVYRQAELVL